MNARHLALLVPLPFLSGCGDSGRQTADVVQAASKAAAETGQQLAEKVAELAHTTPEQAKQKLQELVDAAALELKQVRDSETARTVAAEVQSALEELGRLGLKLGEKLNLAGLQTTVVDLIER